MYQLYDSHSIDACDWPDSQQATYAKDYLVPIIKNGVSHYFRNLNTSLYVLRVDDAVLPVTVNDCVSDNCYVCSPRTYYLKLSADEMKCVKNPLLRGSLRTLIHSMDLPLRWGKLDRVVMVNNWLLGTNLYPRLTKWQIQGMLQLLIEKFPDHMICFRSVHHFNARGCYEALQKNNFSFVGSREIFFLDPTNPAVFKARMFKSDLKVLKNTSYKMVRNGDLTQKDLERILELYNKLYLQKHSRFNPQMRLQFLENILENGLWQFIGFKKEGRIDAILGYFTIENIMTSSFFGYDIDLPLDLGLYRLLSCALTLEAKEKGILLNQSSGANSFKKLRRASPSIEYLAIYDKHLTAIRKMPWFFLRHVVNRIGIPLMQRCNF